MYLKKTGTWKRFCLSLFLWRDCHVSLSEFIWVSAPHVWNLYFYRSWVGDLLAVFRAKKVGLQRDDVFYTCLFACIGLIVGGKILYLVTLIPLFVEQPGLFASQEVWIAILRGGFVFYGGLFGALLMIWWYVKLYKIPFFFMLDRLIPSVPACPAFGRIGCFCAGCCYGVPSVYGLEFNASEIAPHHVKLLPVQLIEAACNIVLFVLLMVLSRFCKRRGVLTGTYLAGYAVMRFDSGVLSI